MVKTRFLGWSHSDTFVPSLTVDSALHTSKALMRLLSDIQFRYVSGARSVKRNVRLVSGICWSDNVSLLFKKYENAVCEVVGNG